MIAFSQGVPWDLRQRGLKDALRHDKKVQDAIKENLKELIIHEDIILSDGTQRIRFPMKYLDQYHFKNGSPPQQVGQGLGNVGDILWQPGQSQPGDQPGHQPGEHSYDVEIDLAMLTKMMLDDLALPWLEVKPSAHDLVADTVEWTDRRRKGMPGNIDKRQTIKENIKRNAMRHTPGVHDIRDEDLRYKAWRARKDPITNAVIYLLTDWSGSMTVEKRYIAKATCFWIVQFLRLKYTSVTIVFIAHDTEAEIVSEQDFFGKNNGGGTVCSSAYTVALREITRKHPKSLYNVYLWHFSDGENLDADNSVCLQRVTELLQLCTMVAYVEIAWQQQNYFVHQLIQTFRHIVHPRFVATVAKTREDIQQILHVFLGADAEAGNQVSA